MKHLLAQLTSGTPLSAAQAQEAFTLIMSGHADPAQIAALLSLLAAREPTAEELTGAARVMRRHVVPIPAGTEVIDTCGTGGTGSRIFNVSTTAAIVAAAAGVPVAKHGNRSITSRSGSSDVLSLLGVNIHATPDVQARCLKEANICFAFAPDHHPAMKHVAAIRQALGFSTIFNLLGPLANPAGVTRQLIGTRSPALADKLLAVLIALGASRAMAVHGHIHGATQKAGSGLGELSVSGPTYVVTYDAGRTTQTEITPRDVGLTEHPIESLEITSPEDSAQIIRAVLAGQKDRSGPREMVLLNAAAALWVGGQAQDLSQGVTLAAATIDSGAAARTLEKWAQISHS